MYRSAPVNQAPADPRRAPYRPESPSKSPPRGSGTVIRYRPGAAAAALAASVRPYPAVEPPARVDSVVASVLEKHPELLAKLAAKLRPPPVSAAPLPPFSVPSARPPLVPDITLWHGSVTSEAARTRSIATLREFLGEARFEMVIPAAGNFRFVSGIGAFIAGIATRVPWADMHAHATLLAPPATVQDWLFGLIVAEFKDPGSCTVALQLVLDAYACKLDVPTPPVDEAAQLGGASTDPAYRTFVQFIKKEMTQHKRFLVLSSDASQLGFRFANLARSVKNPF